MQRLGKRAKLLADKGVYVILVHAQSAKEKSVNSLLKEHEIDFTSGLLERDDIYRIRRAWGAKLLPWLILSDKDHVITADGFGIGELNRKIEEASEAGN